MGCNCGKNRSGRTASVHQVTYANGQVRNYLTAAEAEAAVRAAGRTSNPATYKAPAPA